MVNPIRKGSEIYFNQYKYQFKKHPVSEFVQIFSVLVNRFLSDIWAIGQKCQYGRTEKDIYFLDSIQILVQASTIE